MPNNICRAKFLFAIVVGGSLLSPLFKESVLSLVQAEGQNRRMRHLNEPARLSKPQAQTRVALNHSALRFEPLPANDQAPAVFLARGAGYQVALRPNTVRLTLARPSAPVTRTRVLTESEEEAATLPTASAPAVVEMRLVDANPQAWLSGAEKLEGQSHYFTGRQATHWRTAVPQYARVLCQQVYPGIDLVYYGQQQQLEYDFQLAPGADPQQIRLAFSGATQLTIGSEGDLLLQTPGGVLRQHKPVVYQQVKGTRREIEGSYVLLGENEVGFRVGAYDKRLPLVIDPVLSYSTLLGGGSTDTVYYMTVDAAGNAYFIGETQSFDFPVKNPMQPTKREPAIPRCADSGGCTEAFVGKLNAAGQLVYATYLGGLMNDTGFGLAVDAAGNAYLTGFTQSPDFPVTPGAFQPERQGGGLLGRDAFVAKLSADGGTLLYCSFLGGGRTDRGFGIGVDAAGNAWVTGRTDSIDFPLRRPLRAAKESIFGLDGFIAKISPDGGELLFSTYWGGNDDDQCNAIALDRTSNVYVTGSTVSEDFPVTAGAYQPVYGGSDDVFVSKLNADGSRLLFSTYVGGESGDVGLSLALDAAGNSYVSGFSGSFDGFFGFPLVNPVQTVTDWRAPGLGPPIDAIMFKLNATGTALLFSTYLGGSLREDSNGNIAVDVAGRLIFSGYTESVDLPVTPDALQPVPGGGFSDAYLAVIDPARQGWEALRYASYLGGNAADYGQSAGFDAAGNFYLAGLSTSFNGPNNFPLVNPLQNQAKGYSDGFLAKIIPGARNSPDTLPPALSITSPTSPTDVLSSTPRLTITGNAADNTGVTHVSWRRELGDADLTAGAAWGVAEGTSNWQIKDWLLQSGLNRLIVTARDAAGNSASVTLAIRYQPEYAITTFAGGGFTRTDQRPATEVRLEGEPLCVITDNTGNVYFSGLGVGTNINIRSVWKVNPAGIATRIAGTGAPGVIVDNIPATQSVLNSPYALAADGNGNVYIADGASGLVRRVTPNGLITTIAGTKDQIGCAFSGDGGPATQACFGEVRGVAVDRAGNVYVSDMGNNRIRKIDLNGIVTTIAGTGVDGFGGDGGPATQAQLSAPHGLAFDSNENLYFADYGSGRIRRIARDGTLTTVAGAVVGQGVREGAPATSGRIATPIFVTFDRAGRLLIGSPDSNRVYRVNADGLIETIAGDGYNGFGGDGGTSLFAKLNRPFGVASDAQGRIYIADAGNRRIRRLTPVLPSDTAPPALRITQPTTASNYVSTLPMLTLAGDTSDNAGVTQVKWSNDRGGGGLAIGTTNWRADGIALQDGFNLITVTAKDTAGLTQSTTLNVQYLRDTAPPVVRIVAPTTTGNFTASASVATLTLSGTAADNQGIARMWWQDDRGFRGTLDSASNWQLKNYELHAGQSLVTVYAEDATGNQGSAALALNWQPEFLIQTVAGPGNGAYLLSTDNRPLAAQNAFVALPNAIAFDAAGNLYIGETVLARILKVTPDGLLRTIAGLGGSGRPENGQEALTAPLTDIGGLAFDASGTLHFTTDNRVLKITGDGKLALVAGRLEQGFDGDGGAATQALLSQPAGLVFDRAGNLYIADRFNSRIRKVAPNGLITTIAGGLAAPNFGDGGPALQAQLSGPSALTFDQAGNLFIADTGTSRIRKIAPNGIISTVAGSGNAANGFSGDGGPATAALLSVPRGVAVDGVGNVYIADTGNQRIRRVNAAGVITTIAGTGLAPPGEAAFRGDGEAALWARMQPPSSVALDSYGTPHLADQDNFRIRKLVRYGAGTTAVASVSAASYSGIALARESVVAAYGERLAGVTQSATSVPLPLMLAGSRVLIRDSSGIEHAAPLFFASPTQLNYLIPAAVTSGSATVTVLKSNGELALGAVQINRLAPGIFAANANGQGAAAAVALRVKATGEQSFEPVTQLDPASNRFVARPLDLGPDGERVYLLLFGTGWRFRRVLNDVSVTIGNATVPAEFAGAQGSLVGLDQVNLLLPRSLRGGGLLNLRLTVEGQTSNNVQLSFR